MQPEITTQLIEHSIYRMNTNTGRISKCLEELNEEEIWKRPNESSNSIGNLILHLCGNIRQYIISSLGDTTDVRERDKEFSTRVGLTKKELFQKLESTVAEAVAVIQAADEQSLLEVRSVQGYSLTGIAIVLHVLEHYSYHTGQIVFWTKLLKDKDLGFYSSVNLNIKNVTGK